MALITLNAKTAIMDIIPRMTAITENGGVVLAIFYKMACVAFQVFMRPLKLVVSLAVMVELPSVPGIRVVAILALGAK